MLQPAAALPAKILIVEDSPTQAKLLEQVLLANGYRVLVSSNGRKALDHILDYHPDLVISDILMPGMDGFELCRQVRRIEAYRCLPIILLTNLNNPADVLHSLEAGADYFISKPYNTTEILSRIRVTLQRGNVCYVDGACGEANLTYRDHNYTINAPKAQIIELLLATYELAAEKNLQLMKAKQELSELNQELELRVNERTAELVAETAERVQVVEDLRKQDKIMMRQSRQAALGEMVGNVAHQWRQPLNVVGLHVQDLGLSYEHGNLSKEYLDTSVKKIMKLVQHMSQTVDDFRNFFAPCNEKVDIDWGKTVAKTIALVEGSLFDQGIRIQTGVQEVPNLRGYPNELSQVLLNILNNAKDAFSGRTGDGRSISVKLFAEDTKTVVTITDNAGGIPEEIIGRIFEPYFTTKEQGKGTGIGLYMSKNIVEKAMNGSLTVRNTGLGAEFKIEV
jgi:signal transduction histidine kinase